MRSDVFADELLSTQLVEQPVFALSGYDAAAFATIGLPSRSWLQPAKAGGARRDRTDDLMLAKHALSQLSYGPEPEDECCCRMLVFAQAGYAGHASLSSSVAAPRVAEGEAWWAWEDLNFRPHAYQARALTN